MKALKSTIIVAILSVMVSGCTKKGDTKYLIGFSQCNNAEPWRQAMNSDAKKEAEKHKDIKLEFTDAQQDNSKQIADVEGFIRKKVDLLIISPNEAKPLSGVVSKAYQSGIPVIVLDRGLETDDYTCFIGADNRLIGEEAGRYIAERLNGMGKIVEIQGLPGSPPAIDRSEGFRAVIKEYPGIEIVHTIVADWLRPRAITQMEIVLRAQEDIDLVYAHNDPMAIGAYLAAENVNREDDMLFVGIDALPDPSGGVKAVIDGKLSATFLYPTCGKEAIEYAVKILNGEDVPKKVTLETAVITKENAEKYYDPEMKFY